MSPIMDLPAEIVADILSRISIRTLVQASCVCKSWRGILSELYFINLHLSRSPPGILLHEKSYKREDDVFIVGELDDKSDKPDRSESHKHDIQPVTKFVVGIGLKDSVYLLEGSVNGLICVWHRDAYYICNPITRESLILPDHKYTRYFSESYVYIFQGFGFVETRNQYKVVCFYEVAFKSTEGLDKAGCLVYTLGTGVWRNLEYAPSLLHDHRRGIFFSGNLHWLANSQKDTPNNEMVCTFDLDKELFQLTTSAPRLDHENADYRRLGMLRGCLCICDNTADYELVIWVMKDYGMKESWTKEIVIRNKPTDLLYGRIHPVKELNDGTILMECYGDFLFTYHPENKTLQIYEGGARPVHDAMVYFPSFIRLEKYFSEKVSALQSSFKVYARF